MFKKLYLLTLARWLPTDLFSYRQPVTVKGVCLIGGKVALVRTREGYWDLPGGKLSRDERIGDCLERELWEELGIRAHRGILLDAVQLRVNGWVNVVSLVYLCHTADRAEALRSSEEHSEVGLFDPDSIGALNLPDVYRKAIATACQTRASEPCLPKPSRP
jgi:8-oxo-dGTP pyrophosphatase MutT (NUDIX family)